MPIRVPILRLALVDALPYPRTLRHAQAGARGAHLAAGRPLPSRKGKVALYGALRVASVFRHLGDASRWSLRKPLIASRACYRSTLAMVIATLASALVTVVVPEHLGGAGRGQQEGLTGSGL